MLSISKVSAFSSVPASTATFPVRAGSSSRFAFLFKSDKIVDFLPDCVLSRPLLQGKAEKAKTTKQILKRAEQNILVAYRFLF